MLSVSSCSQTTKKTPEQVSLCVECEKKNNTPQEELSKEKKPRPKVVQLTVKEHK